MSGEGEFLKYIPEIIKAAAADKFGILALLIISTALVGFFFFRRSRLVFRAATLAVFTIGTAAFATVAMVQTSSGLVVEKEYLLEGPTAIYGPSWSAVLSKSIVDPDLRNKLVRLEEVIFSADVIDESAEQFAIDFEILQFGNELNPSSFAESKELVQTKDLANLGSRAHVVVTTNHQGRVPGSKTPFGWAWHQGITHRSNTLDVKPQANGPAQAPSSGLQTRLICWSLWGGGPHRITFQNIKLKLKLRVWPLPAL